MVRVHRRTFLAWAIGGVLAAIGAVVAAVLAVFLLPPAPRQRVRIGRPLPELRDGEAVRITSAAGSAFVLADGGGNNRAGDAAATAYVVRWCGRVDVLAATCSHLGCTVDFDTSAQRFVCPCHGSSYAAACRPGTSQFAVDGSAVHGPASEPLAHIRWSAGRAPDEILLDQVDSRDARSTTGR